MTDSIERRIAERPLPEPTAGLGRRIDALLSTRRKRQGRQSSRGQGVLALAGGALAAGLIGLAVVSPMRDRQVDVAESTRPEPPIVKTVDIAIPPLGDSSTQTVNEQDRLFPGGTIVVSTSNQHGESE